MPTSDLTADLQAMRAALTRQLDAIDEEAAHVGITRERVRDTDGGYVAAPLLVALANVQIAMLAMRCQCESYTIRTDYGTGVEYDVDRASCPIHAGDTDA